MKTLLLISGILLLLESIVLGYLVQKAKRHDDFIDMYINPYMLNELLKYTRATRPGDPIIQQLEHDLGLQQGEELEIKLPEYGK